MKPRPVIATALLIGAGFMAVSSFFFGGGVGITDVQQAHDGDISVDRSNLIEAESDKYFFELQAKGPVNVFQHRRDVADMDNQLIVRENRDTLYSFGIVDVSKGATFTLPESDIYQSIMILDQSQYVVAVIYSGESITISREDLSFGEHVYAAIRTSVKSSTPDEIKEAQRLQDLVTVRAGSDKPYVHAGYDQEEREELRLELEKEAADLVIANAFGPADKPSLTDNDRLLGASMGWGGLDTADAHYELFIAPDNSGVCSSLTFDKPELKDKGFFSITTYGPDAFIHTDNFALSSYAMKPNTDGTYTVNFNCEGATNNLDVVEGWTGVLRMYTPVDTDNILEFAKNLPKVVTK